MLFPFAVEVSYIFANSMLGFNQTPQKNGHIYFSPANSVMYDRVT